MATCAGTEGFLGFVSRGDADPGSRASKAAGTRREDGAASRERPGESPCGSRAARGDLPARERVKRASTEVEIIPRSRDRQRVDKKNRYYHSADYLVLKTLSRLTRTRIQSCFFVSLHVIRHFLDISQHSRLKDLYVACLFSVTHFEKAKKTHSRSSFHHGSKKPSSSYVPLTFVDV